MWTDALDSWARLSLKATEDLPIFKCGVIW
jgi:hypothetical protein